MRALGREPASIEALDQRVVQLMQLRRNRVRREPCDAVGRASDPIEREPNARDARAASLPDLPQREQSHACDVADESQRDVKVLVPRRASAPRRARPLRDSPHGGERLSSGHSAKNTRIRAGMALTRQPKP